MMELDVKYLENFIIESENNIKRLERFLQDLKGDDDFRRMFAFGKLWSLWSVSDAIQDTLSLGVKTGIAFADPKMTSKSPELQTWKDAGMSDHPLYEKEDEAHSCGQCEGEHPGIPAFLAQILSRTKRH